MINELVVKRWIGVGELIKDKCLKNDFQYLNMTMEVGYMNHWGANGEPELKFSVYDGTQHHDFKHVQDAIDFIQAL